MSGGIQQMVRSEIIRGRFRESFETIRRLGEPGRGADLLPKPVGGRIPLLITGGSQQVPDWVAAHGDGWMTYPRDAMAQGCVIADYRRRIAEAGGQEQERDHQ